MAEIHTKDAEKLQAEKRIIPGGYFCNQKLDEIKMFHAEILRDLDSITGASNNKEEIFRLIARIYDQAHKADKAVNELKMIYK